MATAAQQIAPTSTVRELAAELLPRAPELALGLTEHLAAVIPDLREADDEGLRQERLASSEANIHEVLRLLAAGAGAEDVVAPRAALDYTRGAVRRGLTLAPLLRSYHLGHAWLWERWSRALQERVEDANELALAQEQCSSFFFAYVDRVCDTIVEEFGTERERLMRSAAQLRAETARAIIDGHALDEEVASRRLNYELGRYHLALQVSSSASEVRGLERAVSEAAASLGPLEPLVIPSGAARFDVWCGAYEPPSCEALERYEPPPGVIVAFGRPAHGSAGFRKSHLEALQAARISLLADGATGAVTSYARVELVSLLASDLNRARAFVADQLGLLAAPTEPAKRLRETVLAFLASGGSATRVAKDLYVHQNTVAYRVKRAEELLGRRVSERPIELTCALTLTATLGHVVLTSDGERSELL